MLHTRQFFKIFVYCDMLRTKPLLLNVDIYCSQRAGQVDANCFSIGMVEKFHSYQMVVLLYKSKKLCMPDSRVVQFFPKGHFLHHPPKHNGIIQYVNCRNICGREVTFLFILGWNIILLDQTKVKSQEECQNGPKSPTWVSGCHCLNSLCCRNSV